MPEFAKPAEIIDFVSARRRLAPNVPDQRAIPEAAIESTVLDNSIFAWPEYPVKYKETLAGIKARIELALTGEGGTEVIIGSIASDQKICRALDEKGAETEESLLSRDFLNLMLIQMRSYGFDNKLGRLGGRENTNGTGTILIYTSPIYPLQFISRLQFIDEDERQIEWSARKDKDLGGLRRIK